MNWMRTELLSRLGSWSPVVRERAAMALARREKAPVSELVKMLDSPQLESRYGACQALALLKGAAAPAVPALKKALRHDDLWLRVKAAEALAGIGSPRCRPSRNCSRCSPAVPPNDPRGMEQRYLCFALFNQRNGMLGRSLEASIVNRSTKRYEPGWATRTAAPEGASGRSTEISLTKKSNRSCPPSTRA
jgi:hypothetical protein